MKSWDGKFIKMVSETASFKQAVHVAEEHVYICLSHTCRHEVCVLKLQHLREGGRWKQRRCIQCHNALIAGKRGEASHHCAECLL